MPLVDGVEGDGGRLRVLGTALPPPHLHTRSGPRHRDHQHQLRRVLQCEPSCERTHFILNFPSSSPPPALPLTDARAAHLDLLGWKKVKELIGQKWGWLGLGGNSGRTEEECARAPAEPLSAQKVRQVLVLLEESSPAFHYLHPSAAAALAPSYLPHCCAEKLLCHQLRTCRRSVLPQQQGYSRDVTKHLGVYANLINKGCSSLRWKT